MIIDDLKTRISEFLKDGDLVSFRAWFAPLPLDIDQSQDRGLIRLVYAVERELADFDESFLDEYNLTQNLQAKLQPSATSGHLVMSAGTAGYNQIVSGVASGTSTVLAPAETVQLSSGVLFASAL
jgi:hypothetical protein